MRKNNNNLVFFLGGHDLEMITIAELLKKNTMRFFDKNLLWGAKTSAYAGEITDALGAGITPVIVEIIDDMGLHDERIINIDHHGELDGATKQTSLHQVFELLRLPKTQWTRWHELVAANDRGYIPELIKIGANHKEIIHVRAEDRKAQGITPEDELQGLDAIAKLKLLCNGKLTVVNLPHSRTAVVTDFLQPELGGPGYKNLIVLCPNEINFFGSGDLVSELNKKFLGGWYGGALPEYGFWGYGEPHPDMFNYLLQYLKESISCDSKSAPHASVKSDS